MRRFDRESPHCIDMLSPPDGHHRKLDDMLAWCGERGGDWQSYGARSLLQE
jgi:hypothetical protein